MDNLIEKARAVAASALTDETRYDGSPFIGHPDSVARIVEDEIGLPDECVAAVYLHEATRIHKDIDISAFPQDVRTIVDGLNKISTIKPKDTRLEAENYKKLIVQYSRDPRVIVLKIADRLEVMRNLRMFPKSSRDQKLLETTMLYMPLAHQLGLYNINTELGNIYFRYSNPEQYRAITNKLKATEKDREQLTAEFIRPLERKLSEAGIKYKLKARTKSAFSIYRKMQVQKVPFEGVHDVFAIRFIIDCADDPRLEKDLCWKVYSYVTEEYEPDISRLRDWLTTPRPNGYESLHITVKNKLGQSLEVQIRTKRMDIEAESGNAAHWAYKGIRHEASIDRWLQSVRDSLEHPLEASPEHLPAPPDKEIFVFTPTGELRILAAGSSVLDFAFSIHTNLGSRCTGGKVNGKPVQIKEKLKTGDVVEIMTGKNQKPSRDWLAWVVTSKARTKIRQELDAEERKAAAEGREILERRLRNWKLEFPDELLTEFMKSARFNSEMSMMAAIAAEELDINDIKEFLLQKQAQKEEHASQKPDTTSEEKKTYGGSAASSDDILVINAKNVKGLDYKLSKCCNPVFGDDVFGFVTRTEGIKIHRMSCPNAARLIERFPYRIQKVVWQDNASSGDFQCTLSVTAAIDHPVLSSIMDVIGQFRVSMRSCNVKENPRTGSYEIQIRLLVPSNTELDKVISQISNMKAVTKVKRI
ncbi:MAG: bifunctional (p)ppGpp synthetase/guanosine-3',5'-bis(diphosphate) 3'-pyrophosphohydrolase [Bacteroidetes bacterium]|uniref:Bifunctional (P)ppGpp synthetase/guanosine-3',5'-bis(Diphosphate) 3'-pyrophosphohydrolase n=1 Tax=Candidatus Cryptobacteroides avistercoris TaxID=2840758 RepID=A0A9D9IY09_9BACT|nr:bifunctional (p)ppGpp synthetase/guanosine-3',5'-bis(diphosphate) 3'-pyrophosphohydrolase [Candidatus Cryptobacteroides avistercoris]